MDFAFYSPARLKIEEETKNRSWLICKKEEEVLRAEVSTSQFEVLALKQFGVEEKSHNDNFLASRSFMADMRDGRWLVFLAYGAIS